MKFSTSETDETVLFPTVDEEDFRIVGLYGPLTDKKASDIVYSMLSLRHTGERVEYKLNDEQKKLLKEAKENGEDTIDIEEEEIEKEIIYDPFKFLISTPGGVATEMLAIYDVMRSIRDIMEIHTVGMGKVMSAGVPLLAAGTKGKRKIGAHCRVMIHSVVAGTAGSMHDIEVEVDEIKFMQSQYVKLLKEETKMTKKQIESLINRKTNCYFSAEEAVKYGIADIIV